jgi:hypothetical protein
VFMKAADLESTANPAVTAMQQKQRIDASI